MPPPSQRSFPNPAPQTDSARETLKSFYCTLCQKGYSRAHEFAAHESSYEHNHKQRLKDLKTMNRTMADATGSGGGGGGQRRDESGKSGLIKITPIAVKSSSGGGRGFKKGGFKSAFGKAEEMKKNDGGVLEEKGVVAPTAAALGGSGLPGAASSAASTLKMSTDQESDTDDEGYEVYNPRRPTDCGPWCKARG